MIRKTLFAVAAAATLALGLGAATAPAEAKVHIFIGSPYYGVPHVGYYHPRHRYYQPDYVYYKRAPYHCHVRKVWRDGYKVRVKRCHRAWH